MRGSVRLDSAGLDCPWRGSRMALLWELPVGEGFPGGMFPGEGGILGEDDTEMSSELRRRRPIRDGSSLGSSRLC